MSFTVILRVFLRTKACLNNDFYETTYRKVVYPTDFPRRSRPYDHPSYKAHEWRQMGLFLFPIIVRCLPSTKGHEKSVFIAFGFLNRAICLPDNEYRNINVDDIDSALNILEEHYEKAFGQTANMYNFHIISAHLKELRAHYPLTQHSAYVFEGSYADLRRSFVPGTRKSRK